MQLILELWLKPKDSNTLVELGGLAYKRTPCMNQSQQARVKRPVFIPKQMYRYTTWVTNANTGPSLHCQHSAVLIDN